MEFGSFMVTSVLFLEFSRRGILGVGWFVINSIVAVISYVNKAKKKEKFLFFYFLLLHSVYLRLSTRD